MSPWVVVQWALCIGGIVSAVCFGEWPTGVALLAACCVVTFTATAWGLDD
ncbi:MAG: hypothetical protein AAGE52_01560 [Myxococcota bacterium]